MPQVFCAYRKLHIPIVSFLSYNHTFLTCIYYFSPFELLILFISYPFILRPTLFFIKYWKIASLSITGYLIQYNIVKIGLFVFLLFLLEVPFIHELFRPQSSKFMLENTLLR